MFGEWIVRFRWAWVVLILAALLGAVYLLPGLEFDQNFDNYFPDKDPDLAFYRKMTAELGDEDDLLQVAVHREQGIFDSVFLVKFQAFTLAAGKLPWVEEARSLTNLDDVRRTPFGNLPTPFIHRSDPALFASDSLKLLDDERLAGRLISSDLKTLTVILELKKQISSRESEALISALESLGREFEFGEMYIMGRKYFEVIHNRVSKKELKKGVFLCIGIIVVLLGFLYLSFWGVMLPLLVFVFSMLMYLGYLVMRGHSLDIINNLSPTILLIVSVSDVIHFLSKYEDQVKAGLGKRAAVAATLNSIGLAILLTSFTTALGFLTLLTSNLPILRKFGGDIAMGVMIAFLVTIILVPFVLQCLPENAIRIRSDWYRWWDRTAESFFRLVRDKPRWIIRSAVFLSLLGFLGMTRINTNNFFASSLPQKHIFTRAVGFYEKNLGGVRTFEIALIPQSGVRLNDLALLKEVEKLDRHIDSLPGTGGVYSPVTFYKTLNKAWHGGQTRSYALPATQEALDRQEQYFQRSTGAIFHRIMNEERTFGKVTARMNDPGRQKAYAFNGEVADWMATHLDTTLLQTRIIGASAMADKIQEHSIRNMFPGLAIALGAVGALIFLLYRKWRIVLIVMVVNLFPLIATAGLMALLRIELRCLTSVIFAIGFVIVVDNTIHFIGRYRMERSQGLSLEAAISATLRQTGRAMLVTSIVLFFGFVQLTLSAFKDAQAVGILVSGMLVFALFADLFLGPLLMLKSKECQTK